MAFFSRFLKRSGSKHFIAIDIGSNSAIRSLHFEETSRGRTTLKKRHFEIPTRTDELELIPFVAEYLHRLIFDYIRDIGQMPEEVLIGIGNRFTFNEVRAIRCDRERPAMRTGIDECAKLLDQFIAQNKERTTGEIRYALAHVMPFKITLDGYEIEDPSRYHQGKILEMTNFATFARHEYWEELTKLRSILGGVSLRFISNQAAIASTIVSAMQVPDALVIKVGARITEVTLIGAGAILFTGQFDVGGDDVTKAIAERVGIAEREAERLKYRWEQGPLPERSQALVAAAVVATTERRLGELVKLLRSEERFLLPEHVFLIGGGAKLASIPRILSSRSWYGDLTFLEKLSVEVLEADRIAKTVFKNTEPLLRGPDEVALAAIAARMGKSTR